jgi:hypothetical protein
LLGDTASDVIPLPHSINFRPPTERTLFAASAHARTNNNNNNNNNTNSYSKSSAG